ncbi:TniB family NTP-binding protein [Bacillus sp. ISL-57]|uniref:TniB family NTP-binding protein n=1 Tax=Bacillus sp. ISL-57 TaxID=2819135 RepID=UPI001BE554F3|nr:TniB family NTP-binding protein [Bacillus sp. ISL-57]MBT2716956.1 TniB family NTP-binding protein [Bacillus sp. ISL-57]
MQNKLDYTNLQRRIINLYVVHPEVERIWNLLDTKRKLRRLGQGEDNDETPVNLFVMGKSRVGKSLMMKKYAKSKSHYTETRPDGTEIDIIPVAYVKLPSPFTLFGLYNQIIDKGLNATRMREGTRISEVKSRAFHLLKEQKVEMLILDEMDYIMQSKYVTNREAMEEIKDITNEAGVILVCVGTPAIENLRKLSGQFVGRFPPTTIPWFKNCDELFIKLLEQIEQDLNSPIPLGFSDVNTNMPKFLHKLCAGLVGWLKPIMVEAFEIVGVLDEDFCDLSKLNLIDGSVLLKARQNVLGELSEQQIEDFLTK